MNPHPMSPLAAKIMRKQGKNHCACGRPKEASEERALRDLLHAAPGRGDEPVSGVRKNDCDDEAGRVGDRAVKSQLKEARLI